MHLITPQSLADTAPQRYSQRYIWSHDPDQSERALQLNQLSKPVDPHRVNEIIGNTSWTSPGACHECGEQRNTLVQLGRDTGDYDDILIRVCQQCLAKALLLFVNELPAAPTDEG